MSKDLPEQLRRAIRADGRTLYRLALDSKVSAPILQRFVNGQRDMTLATAGKVCKALGLRLAKQ